MKRLLTLLALAAVALAHPSFAAEQRPNIVIILADDLGYGGLGCYGQTRYQTPHLDRMAAEGAKLTHFNCPAPFCAPTRAALMTGRYPIRCGMTQNPAPDGGPAADAVALPKSEITLAQIMKSAGYATGMVGKWHLGHKAGALPTERGFDEYYGIPYSNDMRPVQVLDGTQVVEYPVVQATLTRRYTERALGYMERNRHKPFLLYLAQAMPHKPLAASEAFYKKSGAGLYGDAMMELDWSVGQVLAKLKELGLDEKTLVLFTSDNGPERKTPGTAAPLRGTKHTVLEGGLRVPCVAWWPGRVPAGRVCGEFVSTLDVLPTFAALVGTECQHAVDGYDVSVVLLGQDGARSPRTTLYSLYAINQNRLESFREGPWKLHLTTPAQLFDLSRNLAEAPDVAARHPDLVQRLSAAAVRTREETLSANPQP
jgi:arylsulfatase A-like enzyme